MDTLPLSVRLILADPDDPAAADRDMEFLLEEINRLPILSIAHVPAPAAPVGTRASDASIYTSLILGLAGAPALKSLIQLAQDWLARRNSGTIDLKVGKHELHLTSVSRTEQRLVIEAFIALTAEQPVDTSEAESATKSSAEIVRR